MGMSWNKMVVMDACVRMSTPNATELHAKKWLKWSALLPLSKTAEK
jgi:hypothetical protein